MVKYMIFMFFFTITGSSQDYLINGADEVQVGDVFEIGMVQNLSYKHIKFPKANFILKRGGVADLKGVVGKKVLVTSVKMNKDGTTKVKIKRKDGKRFFHRFLTVGADFYKAVEAGELIRSK